MHFLSFNNFTVHVIITNSAYLTGCIFKGDMQLIQKKNKQLSVTRLCIAFMIAMIFFVCSGFKSNAISIRQSVEGDTSATVKWDKPSSTSVTCYYVGYSEFPKEMKLDTARANAKAMADNKTITLGPDATSYTIQGLKRSTRYLVYITFYYVNYRGEVVEGYGTYTPTVYTRPERVTNVKQGKWNYKDFSAQVTWDAQVDAKYEVRLMDKNGKVIKNLSKDSALTSSSAIFKKIKTDRIYKVKVRAYRNRYSGLKVKKSYGLWSKETYLIAQPMVKSASIDKNGALSIKWNKVDGLTSYSVFVSTKEKSGYKKVGLLKANKNSINVKSLKGKKFKPSKKYYVYIVGNIKEGKKKYTSGKHYTCTVYKGKVKSKATF